MQPKSVVVFDPCDTPYLGGGLVNNIIYRHYVFLEKSLALLHTHQESAIPEKNDHIFEIIKNQVYLILIYCKAVNII